MNRTLAVKILAVDSFWREGRVFLSEVWSMVGYLCSKGQYLSMYVWGTLTELSQLYIETKRKKKMALIWEEDVCCERCCRGNEGEVECGYDINILYICMKLPKNKLQQDEDR